MAHLQTALLVLLLILVVVTIFNVIIFVHELGHFLAAKWRGLRIDRFQIWFGKPLWKKEINGVQYGLGWIPAGGFVALPQMAPMEAIEGGNTRGEPLPPIKPIDKIIVAFAGPLFSMLLALLAGVVVWGVGKPKDFVPQTEVGYVVPDSPAARAGLQPGDDILAVNGEPVNGYAGSLDSIQERIILSRGESISLTVRRPGIEEPLTLVTGFETEKTRWFQRRGLRQVGFVSAFPSIVDEVHKDGPAEKAGLKPGDEVLSVDGIELKSPAQLRGHMEQNGWKPVVLRVRGGDSEREVSLTPERPIQPAGSSPMIGVSWNFAGQADTRIVHPDPWTQVVDSLRMMWVTITSVAAPDSNIGIDHLSGPVGIGMLQYDLLQTENGWRRILAFMVLFNVNLAVLNMLPFPVLDGGHITLATLEAIARRPVRARPLEFVQTVFALLLISLMLYVTTKDIGDRLGRGGDSGKIIFSQD